VRLFLKDLEQSRECKLPEVITHLLQRKPLSQQAAGTGMPERVRPAAGNVDSQCAEACADQMLESALGEPAVRCPKGEENLPTRATRTHLLQVSQDGRAGFSA